jgi:hypothetical protein
MNFIYIIILNFRGKATRGTKYSDIKVKFRFILLVEVLKLNGGNSNNKVKACSPSLHLLAFTKDQERELSTIRRRTTCPQTYLSTNTNTKHKEFKSQRSYVRTRHSHKRHTSLDMTAAISLLFFVSFNYDG